MLTIKKNAGVEIINALFRKNKPLALFGAANFLLLGLLLLFSFIDDRTLLGINVWIKPMKFSLSIGIFTWTMAWLLDYLPQKTHVKIIAISIIVMLGIEQIIIIGQAAQGKASHFNISSPFDGMLFSIMGFAIVINTLMVLWTLILFLKINGLPKGYLWGIRFGLMIVLLASFEGFVMIANGGHTVGAADGEEGVFFLNWARRYGDLRISHFLGLHAIQALPLFAWFFSRDKVSPVAIFALIYFLLSVGTLWQALAGKPLIWY